MTKIAPPPHVKWLTKSSQTLVSTDGTSIEVWELKHTPDDATLRAWASHFRNHYCDDSQIDALRDGTPHSRAEYLRSIKFPDSQPPGPSIRSGDFAEVLVADFVEFILGYWVPRTRYDDKTVRNESKKGSDILGFRLVGPSESKADTLLIFESKAQLSGTKAKDIMQQAIDDSAKDELRKAESLNAIKQRLMDRNETENVSRIRRFQNSEDRPYQSLYGAAALFTSSVFDPVMIQTCDTSAHVQKKGLSLLVISGAELMQLVHKLYDLAADEA